MIEKHPFTPFLPEHAKILFLGSFPPQEKRWSMKFYYPNWINDFWRIIGLIGFNDKNHFCLTEQKCFHLDRIIHFCNRTGLAMYDTACEVRRLKDNASDKFLEVVTATDIAALLQKIPDCRAIVTTGEKATETIMKTYSCEKPTMGSSVKIQIPVPTEQGKTSIKTYDFFRMPSTSRAYPLSLEKKAAYYRDLFEKIGISSFSESCPEKS